MSEHGFFHPSRGYWQTTDYPAPEFFAEYPEGTLEVPLKPAGSYAYDPATSAWVEFSPVIDPEVRLATIKAECRRRIYSVASAEAQMNITGAAAAIAAKPEGSRTSEDADLLMAFRASVQWIDDMRSAVATIADDETVDPVDDSSWPECPADVVALAAFY